MQLQPIYEENKKATTEADAVLTVSLRTKMSYEIKSWYVA